MINFEKMEIRLRGLTGNQRGGTKNLIVKLRAKHQTSKVKGSWVGELMVR